MNDDLISRSALKKEVENLVVGGEKGLKDYYENGSKSDENSWIGGVYDAWDLIKYAPTVDAYPFEQVHELVKLNQQFAQEIENLKRPQGEWAEFEGGYRCSNCDDIEVYTPNFCPNCGAKMKGGQE